MAKTDRAWEHFGSTDPYHGVLTKEGFRKEKFDEQARTTFFESGERYVDFALSVVRSNIDAEFVPTRAIDFGCGVGRVTLPLARRCQHATGIDVSEGMLQEAAANAERAGVTNVSWTRSDRDLSGLTGTFDLIHSFIVFQHIMPHRGIAILDRLISVLSEGGIGIIHLTYANRSGTPLVRRAMTAAYEWIPFVNLLRNLVRRQPVRTPMMHMSRYSLNRVLRLLQERGCHDVHLRFTEAAHFSYSVYGVILFFTKRPLETTEYS
jgi:2-polyprenyl-3-methyl-5-hydroxy-6-metoxy-1,4-benzoquinol methylase